MSQSRVPPRIDCGIRPGDALEARIERGQVVLVLRDPPSNRYISLGIRPREFRKWAEDAVLLSYIAEDYEGRNA